MTRTNRADLLGSWQLVAAVAVSEDGQRRDEFGEHPAGYLTYSANGIVSAVLGDRRRAEVDSADPQDATAGDYAQMARRFIAYAGPYDLDEEHGHVTHHIDVALFPNWQGHSQPRRLLLDRDTLIVEASPRTAADGSTFHVEIHWRRVASEVAP